MFRISNLPILIALAVGAAGGWAATSGRLDSLLKADQTPALEPADARPGECPLGGCCEGDDKAKLMAAVAGHNAKVSAAAAQAGKKPNIVVIMGDDIGMWNIGAYHRGLMAGVIVHTPRS
jgi:arylsulfatase